jgi:hypothetical protein
MGEGVNETSDILPRRLREGRMAKAKLGSGKRFKSLKRRLASKGARNPGALAAAIGRKKFGKKRFQQLAARGRRRTSKGGG